MVGRIPSWTLAQPGIYHQPIHSFQFLLIFAIRFFFLDLGRHTAATTTDTCYPAASSWFGAVFQLHRVPCAPVWSVSAEWFMCPLLLCILAQIHGNVHYKVVCLCFHCLDCKSVPNLFTCRTDRRLLFSSFLSLSCIFFIFASFMWFCTFCIWLPQFNYAAQSCPNGFSRFDSNFFAKHFLTHHPPFSLFLQSLLHPYCFLAGRALRPVTGSSFW